MLNRKKLLDSTLRKLLARSLRRAYPSGPDTNRYYADVAPRIMVQEVVEEISAVLAIVGEPVTLALETSRKKNELPIVEALIVYLHNENGNGGRTLTIPMTVTRNTCTVAGNPVYLMTPNAASDLLAAILDAAEYALASDDLGAMAAIIKRATPYDDFDEQVF